MTLDQPITVPEGFSFRSTALSHGWCLLPPFGLLRDPIALERVVRLGSGRVIRVWMDDGERARGVESLPSFDRRTGTGTDGRSRDVLPPGRSVRLSWEDARLSREELQDLRAQVRCMLRLDEDLSEFYGLTSARSGFEWIGRAGAGRLLRSPSVFEDLVKLLCTTNCTWALTKIMVGNLVDALGEPAAGRSARDRSDVPRDAHRAPRAFPTPEVMAGERGRFYEREIRAGYRARALVELAERVATGELDIESWVRTPLGTEALTKTILGVRGAGPYTAQNLLRLLGRYEGLALDSWCRAQYASLHGRRRAASPPARRGARTRTDRAASVAASRRLDAAITRRYARFGAWRGLALWCDLTRSWLEADAAPGAAIAKFA